MLAAAYLHLVVQRELALFRCRAQVVLQRRAGRDGGLHARVKKADAVAPRGLGGIHGQVGVLDHILHRLPLAAEQHGAHTGGAVHMVRCELVGLVERGQNLFAHRLRLLGRIGGKGPQVLQKHQKLVAAQPRNGVALSHAGREPLVHLLQLHVGHVVVQGVVQGIEVVQVQAQQSPLQARARTGGKRLLQTVHHQAAVGQVGERVVERQVLDLPRRRALGDVAEGGHIDGRLQRPRIAQQLAVRPRHAHVDVGGVEQ